MLHLAHGQINVAIMVVGEIILIVCLYLQKKPLPMLTGRLSLLSRLSIVGPKPG
jgi:hypothetical protein